MVSKKFSVCLLQTLTPIILELAKQNGLNFKYLPQYLTQGLVTRPQSINFTMWLRLSLGNKALVFASTTNLESGPASPIFACFTKARKLEWESEIK